MTEKEPTSTVAERLASAIRRAAATSSNEAELLIKVEAELRPVLDVLDIPSHPEYEKRLVLRGRADAVYGFVTIEYEAPGKLATPGGRDEAFRQCRQYMWERALEANPGAPQEALRKQVGVALDGEEIGFVVWRSFEADGESNAPLLTTLASRQLTIEIEDVVLDQFEEYGPAPVNADSITDFLLYLRALSRRPLEAASLAQEFGPDGDTARRMVLALRNELRRATSKRTKMLYAEWMRIFGAVYGDPRSGKAQGRAALAEAYDVPDDDLGEMLFSVQTYFALIMKIIAVELAALQHGAIIEPMVASMSLLSSSDLHRRLTELERGGIFEAQGIENFLEGDFLGWYVDEWSPDLESAIRDLIRRLQEYEPATATLRPELTQDLLKGLYHKLLPRRLRHDLGEYYTPNWLAGVTLDAAGYDGDPEAKLLDPACGSGTFLVLAIRAIRERAAKAHLTPVETAAAIRENVVGFDLNPLAVIAARTNYLLACGDLIRAISPFHIPVYVCDSIMAPSAGGNAGSGGDEPLIFETSVGEFRLPRAMLADGRLRWLSRTVAACVEAAYPSEDFLVLVDERWADLADEDREQIASFYERVQALHKDDRDGIWPRLILNAFAPLFMLGQFDYVVGNPPWISWEAVSPEYRAATRRLWEDYGLFSLPHHEGRLGGGKKDLSMLMTVVAIEEYLKPQGVIAFLITQTVFQTAGAGDGFRRFRTNRRAFGITRVHDLASFNPFEAANWTAMFVGKRDQSTSYPVAYELWRRRPDTTLNRLSTMEQALAATTRDTLQARPVRPATTSQWILGLGPASDAAHYLVGTSDYTAYAGTTTWMDGVFQVEILGTRADGLVRIRNMAHIGQADVPVITAAVEPDLLYPYIPWGNISAWSSRPDRFLLIPQDPDTREPYGEREMRTQWPGTYRFLRRFEAALRQRSGYRRYFDPATDPFWAIYNFSRPILSDWKVVWRTMSSTLDATVIGRSPGPDGKGSKPEVVKNTVIHVPVSSEREGWYVAALLNSTWLTYVARASNVRGGKSANGTNVLQTFRIPAFRPTSPVHRRLSDAGQAAHKAARTAPDTLVLAELEADAAAARVWRLGARAQRAMRESLALLG